MKTYFLPLLILTCLIQVGYTQNDTGRQCHIFYSQNTDSFEKWMGTQSRIKSSNSEEVYTIPVVVHIIHQGEAIGEGLNLSEERILSQIRVLNEDFRRKEGTRGFNNHPDGGDARIVFQLAQTDPFGKATNGIVRVNMNEREDPPFSGSMIALGAYYSFWDPSQYLNIWTFPGVQDFGLGEARFPISDLPGLEDEPGFSIPGIDSLHGVPVSEIDGVAVNAHHFGESNMDSKYNLGRTGTHEIGHFLGLFHIWGDEGFDGSCDIDDYCEDTPNTPARTSGCPQHSLACDGSPAMIENYMDYTDDECMNIFTNDQIDRMRTVLENSPRRNSLLRSPGLFPPDVVDTEEKYFPALRIYPNPASGQVYIDWQGMESYQAAHLYLFDLSGRMLLSRAFDIFGSEKIMLDLPLVGHQILLLRLVTEKAIIDKKIVKL